VLCGHIHEGSGISLIKETNTLVVNPGSVAAFQNKEKVTPYALIKVKEREVEVFIKSWLGDKLLTIVM
jgi:Icc-related predicted phosphoesterase